MSNEQITDLKHFFVTTLDAMLEAKLEAKLNSKLGAALEPVKAQIGQLQMDVIQLFASVERLEKEQKKLRQDMADGFAAIGDALERLYFQEDYHAGLLQDVAHKWGRARSA